MSLFNTMEISAMGMTAQRRRLEVIMSNLANVNTTRTPEGGPYRRRDVVFASKNMGFAELMGQPLGASAQGVEVSEVIVDPTPPLLRFDPSHPDADAAGYVQFPNINPIEETVNMISAARSFQASVTAINAAKEMLQRSLDILR